MAKLFVICGHGAGDSGACGNGYQEQERVRALGRRIKELGGDNVLLGDTSRNYYADNGISSLSISKDYQIIELHMDSSDSSQPHGAHVIIWHEFNADTYDNKLADFLSGLFPGRADKLVKRGNLANPARAASRGYGYRLVECGFISNAADVSIFNSNIDAIARGILSCFGIGAGNNEDTPTPAPAPTPTPTKKSVNEVANEILNWPNYGGWSTGSTRKDKLIAYNGAQFASDVQNRINELLGVSSYPQQKLKTAEQIADDIWNGTGGVDWGTGGDRIGNLDNYGGAGFGKQVQAVINRKYG